MSWIFVLAANARDWTSLALLTIGTVLLYRWSTRAVLRKGPQVARQVMLKFFCVVFLMFAIVVNFRLRDWFVSGAGISLGFPSGDAVPEFPLLATNLLVIAVGAAMILPIAMMKTFGGSPK